MRRSPRDARATCAPRRGSRTVRALLAGALGLASLSFADRAVAGDPDLVWITIHTKHFDVHSTTTVEPVARKIAEVAEDVHTRLAPQLAWEPRERTQIVLTDDTDSANGSATAVPFNTVRLYVTAPDDISPLADYDDWQVELVTHEYTHILHTDHITGLPAIYDAIFGKIYAPNQDQPRWLLEGLAVLMETKYTSGGRNRSTAFDMYLRADVLEDNVASIDQVSHTARRWPQGNLWYLYGSHFLQWIHDVYGEEALRQVAADYGDEIIPYGINRAIHRATGKTYPELWKGWVAWMQKRYAAQKAAIERRGLREGKRLTTTGGNAFHPRYMPARPGEPRTIAFYRDDQHTTSGLYSFAVRPDGTAAPARLLGRTSGPATPNFLPDGSYLYDSIEYGKYHNYYFWDLFYRARGEWGNDVDLGKRLSFGLRSYEPALSPDGSKVAFAVDKAGSSFLYLSDLDWSADEPLGAPKKLVDAEHRYDQVYTPRWSPDGKRIAFSVWSEGGYRDIRVVDVATGKLTELMHDRALDTGPTWSPDGKRLFFSSDRSGVANIYAYDFATGATSQITNVVMGAYQPEISPDGRWLVYVGYSTRGYDLWELPLDPTRELPAEPYVDERGPPAPEPPHLPTKVVPYDPKPTLRPYSWSFSFVNDGFGDAVSVSTSGADVVGHHTYSAQVGIGITRADPNVDLVYGYHRLPFDFQTHFYRTVSLRGGVRVSGQTPTWAEEELGGDTGISIPLGRAFDGQSIGLSYSYVRLTPTDGFPRVTPDPFAEPNVYPPVGNLATVHLGWSWGRTEGFLWSVSAEKGFNLSTSLDVSRKGFGSDYDATVATYSAGAYFPMPWLAHHVLALHAEGGATMGTFGRRGAFAVGGFYDQGLFNSLRNLLYAPSIALRGYKPGAFAGNSFQLFNAEYRFPILNIDHGYQTMPVFIQRIYGGAFADYGNATFDTLDLAKMNFGFGAELFLDATFLYFTTVTMRFGLARGLGAGGDWQTYAVLSQPF
jgi:hypothetical protein